MSLKENDEFMENLQELEKDPTPSKALSLNKQSIQEQNEPVNDYDIDSFLEKRAEFITKVKAIMVEGKDYHVIQTKKSLAKGGAEKIASIFGWTAVFRKDQDVSEAFKIEGLIAFVCDLSKHTTLVGQGRGAATLGKNSGDPNKTIKMAQKSAFIDAVLRASGLSDFFTQDLEDMPPQTISTPTMQNFAVGSQSGSQSRYFCSVHDDTVMLRPAGKTKQGVSYKPFWACAIKDEKGKFCKAPILNSNGDRVRQNPETGEMMIDEPKMSGMQPKGELAQEAITEFSESSVDKARRILNAKVPKGPYNPPEGD